MKSWVVKKKIRDKQNARSQKSSKQTSKNSKLSPKNSKSLSVNIKTVSENSKSLPDNPQSVLVSPTMPPNSLELIDPAIIFTPERKRENLSTLVSILEFNFIECC